MLVKCSKFQVAMALQDISLKKEDNNYLLGQIGFIELKK